VYLVQLVLDFKLLLFCQLSLSLAFEQLGPFQVQRAGVRRDDLVLLLFNFQHGRLKLFNFCLLLVHDSAFAENGIFLGCKAYLEYNSSVALDANVASLLLARSIQRRLDKVASFDLARATEEMAAKVALQGLLLLRLERVLAVVANI